MPNVHYAFLGGGACAAGPGAPLAAMPNPMSFTWPQLLNAQLRLGVYPGGGWNADEINWRVYSLCIGCIAVAGGGGPVIPLVPPALAVVPAAVPGPAVGVANVPPSPVATAVDATERGQIGYHMGTAVGGSLGPYLATAGPGATRWFAFHLTRAIANGGAFTLAGGAPDIVSFSVNPATLNVYEFVAWENKGHCGNFGALAPLLVALAQAQTLVNMTTIPGNPALGVVGGTPVATLGIPPWVPDAHIASQVDVLGGNFRAQTIDPSMPPRPPVPLGPSGMEKFLRAYYAAFVEAIGSGSTTRHYDGRRFRTLEFAKSVRLGLDDEIFAAIRSSGLAQAVANATSKGYQNSSPQTVHIDPTGISVELPKGWTPQGSNTVSAREYEFLDALQS